MRVLKSLCAAAVVVGVSACPAVDVSLPTPLDRFYFPTAIAHLDNPSGPDGGNGLLMVASTDFDKRFAAGSLIAINLDTLSPPLPPFGATPSSPVVQLPMIRSTWCARSRSWRTSSRSSRPCTSCRGYCGPVAIC